MIKIFIQTSTKREVVDITDKINEVLEKQQIKDGVCNLFVTQTTCFRNLAESGVNRI